MVTQSGNPWGIGRWLLLGRPAWSVPHDLLVGKKEEEQPVGVIKFAIMSGPRRAGKKAWLVGWCLTTFRVQMGVYPGRITGYCFISNRVCCPCSTGKWCLGVLPGRASWLVPHKLSVHEYANPHKTDISDCMWCHRGVGERCLRGRTTRLNLITC